MNKRILITLMAGLAMANTYAESSKAESTAKDAPTAESTISTDEIVDAVLAKIEERMKFSGDIRLRYEHIDKEGADTRDRERMRVRAQVNAKVSDEVSTTIGVATGDGNPVSSNVTLDDGFSSKDLRLDLAVVTIKPKNIKGFKAQLGKMKTPFIRVNSLVWDSDLRPEGAVLSYKGGGDGLGFILNGGAFSVEENSSDDDTILYGGQAAVLFDTAAVKTEAGASYYYYDNIEGHSTIYYDNSGDGNSTIEVIDPETGDVSKLVYETGFEIIELFAKAGFDIGIPVTLNGSYVMNQDADADDTGYQGGIKFGKRKKAGTYDLSYEYRRLEANAVLGIFTDSDPYLGGTDGKSHIVKAAYQIQDNLSFDVAYYNGQRGLDDGVDVDGFQIDLVAKF